MPGFIFFIPIVAICVIFTTDELLQSKRNGQKISISKILLYLLYYLAVGLLSPIWFLWCTISTIIGKNAHIEVIKRLRLTEIIFESIPQFVFTFYTYARLGPLGLGDPNTNFLSFWNFNEVVNLNTISIVFSYISGTFLLYSKDQFLDPDLLTVTL